MENKDKQLADITKQMTDMRKAISILEKQLRAADRKISILEHKNISNVNDIMKISSFLKKN